MEWALAEPRVDAFEFQNLAEWDPRTPSLDEGEKRLAAWTRAEKHSIEEPPALLIPADLPILSVYAKRDVADPPQGAESRRHHRHRDPERSH